MGLAGEVFSGRSLAGDVFCGRGLAGDILSGRGLVGDILLQASDFVGHRTRISYTNEQMNDLIYKRVMVLCTRKAYRPKYRFVVVVGVYCLQCPLKSI